MCLHGVILMLSKHILELVLTQEGNEVLVDGAADEVVLVLKRVEEMDDQFYAGVGEDIDSAVGKICPDQDIIAPKDIKVG
jgi:hypothetical protein